MNFDLHGQVAIVTGAGRGLGRSHALALAARGARVVVNDLAERGEESESARAVVREIREKGGSAIATGANVSDFEQVESMLDAVVAKWGRVDILVNNAGILRDKTFSKMSMDDFRLVIDVHLMGSVNCTKAVWATMCQQNYGRIVLTTSSSGLYGNFGQSNYGAAKMAMLGFMNTLHLEGKKYNIRVNCLAPTAGTAMTKGLFPDAVFELMTPDSVSPAVVFLCASDAPSRKVVAAGGGSFAVYKGFETEGLSLAPENVSAEGIAAAWEAINAEAGMRELGSGFEQPTKFAMQAAQKLGLDLT
tara:strand:+ start:603 stop:1511 length:909 start_codon:yes stop_codon:yes gene_type:complete